MLALGVSPFIMASTESLVGFVLNGSLEKFGDIYVGALAILQSAMQLVSVPLTGFAQGFVPVASYNYGHGDRQRVKMFPYCTDGNVLFQFCPDVADDLFPYGSRFGIYERSGVDCHRRACAAALPGWNDNLWFAARLPEYVCSPWSGTDFYFYSFAA